MSSSEIRTSYRSEWTIQLPASQLLEAAKAKIAYHEGRIGFWQDERDKAETEVRESMQLRAHDVTGGQRYGLDIDSDKAQRLAETKQKIEKHQGLRRVFQNWQLFLAQSGEDSLTLTQGDVAFFELGNDLENAA